MQKAIVALAALLLLAGCNRYPGGSLPHALAALRAGDYDDFLSAKKESEEEIKGAIQADGDLCLTSPRDFTKYRVRYSIMRMDHKELFALPEDERLLFALKVAARLELEPGNFLEHAPVTRMSGFDPVCQTEKEKMMAALQSDGGYSHEVDEGRLRLLKDWIAEVRDRHGAQMDDKMHDAAAHLDAIGYTAKWPTDPLDG